MLRVAAKSLGAPWKVIQYSFPESDGDSAASDFPAQPATTLASVRQMS
jgi:hypothetical protein